MASFSAKVLTDLVGDNFMSYDVIDNYQVGNMGELVIIKDIEFREIAIATYAPGAWKAIFVVVVGVDPVKSDKE